MVMRTANPALGENVFSQGMEAASGSERMSVQGATYKTLILLGCVLVTAGWTWTQFFQDPTSIMPYVWGGSIGGLIAAIVTIFKKTWAPVTAPIYALLEGLALGGISALFESRYPGLPIQAVGLTFGTLFALLMAYTSGVIKATDRFRRGVVAATGGIAVVYLISFVLGFFGVNIPFIHGSGWVGIGFSLFVVVVAALNLVLDFDFIEQGADQGAPKYMEWYGAFGLMVTLIWLYIEILRLLSKLRSREYPAED